MLDRKFVLENAAAVKENCRRRGAKADVDRFVELETLRRQKQMEVEQFNRQANEVSKTIGKAKDEAEREARKAEGRRLREQVATVQTELEQIAGEGDAILGRIPNMSHPDAPQGADDTANLEIRKGKHAPPKFSFKPLDHVQLG